jgi:hypothetical protein
MRSMLPQLNFKATSQLRAGSVIEYDLDNITDKTARAIALVLRVDWNPRHRSSLAHILTGASEQKVIDLSRICKVHVI